MRISSNQYHSTMQRLLSDASGNMSDLLQQMASGKRLLAGSDDPIASVRLLRLEREQSELEQYVNNIGAVRARLSQNETLLTGMRQDMDAAYDQLLTAANSPTPEDLKAMATPLVSLRDSLYFNANTRNSEGHYLFSGSALASPAITMNASAAPGSRYSYTGNGDAQRVAVGHDVTETANVTLDNLAATLNQLDVAIASLQAPDAATQDTVRATLGQLDSGRNEISGKIAVLGGRQNTLRLLADNHDNMSLANQDSMNSLSSLDYADAFIKMNGYQLSLAASQKAYGRVSSLTLFDVL